MILNSLKSRIIISITGIVIISLAITTFFFAQKANHELSNAIEGNALNLLKATKNHVESQHSSILYYKSAMLSRRKKELKNNVTIAFEIIKSAYRRHQNELVSEETAKKQAVLDLKQLRYDNSIGYFWINDTSRPYPRMIMHPIFPKLNGKILDSPKFNCALGRKENLFKAFVDVCLEKDEGYVNYLWPKPIPWGLTEQQPKISYAKLFKPWDWILGTGVYIDDIERDVQNRIDAVIKDLNKTIIKQRIAENGYFLIFNEDNYMLVHPTLAGTDGKQLTNPGTGNSLLDEFKKRANSHDHSMEYLWDKPDHKGEYRFPKKAYVTYYKPLGWYICSTVYKEDSEKIISDLTNTIFLFCISFLLIAFIISLIVSRSITSPLNMLINAISKTDKDGIPINTIPKTGITEIKILSDTMNNMINTISKSGKALRTSEEKHRRLVENLGKEYFLYSHDTDGVMSYVSPSITEMLGYVQTEFMTHYTTHLTSNPVNEESIRKTEDCIKGIKQQPYLIEIFHKSRDLRWLEITEVPIFDSDGRVIAVEGIAHDITERKQAEKDLNQLRNYLSNIIDSMPSILVGVDTENRITLWNNEARRTTGVSSMDAVGKPLEHLLPSLRAEIERVHKAIKLREVQSDLRVARMEHGEKRYENITVYPLISNGVEGAVLRVDNVTEQVRLEEMMVQSEKMLSVGGLAAGMAHEINNPLGGMIQATTVMTNRLTNLEIPANIRAAEDAGTSMDIIRAFMETRDIPKMLALIRESGQRAAEIVSNMLSFARKSNATFSSQNPAELLDRSIDLAGSDYDLKKKYDFRQIEIIREYEHDLPFIHCESGKIQQVFLNILRNGAEAMQESMEKGTIKQPCFILRLTHEQETFMVRIEIEDNGSGIDEKTCKRVFEPFFTTKPTDRGTGLGLSVSYFIITENHRGSMSVASEPGRGTTFIIRLPIKR